MSRRRRLQRPAFAAPRCRGPPPRPGRHRTSSSRASERPVVDLPQPDSPTSDSVSPALQLEAELLHRVHLARHAAEQAAGQRKARDQALHAAAPARRSWRTVSAALSGRPPSRGASPRHVEAGRQVAGPASRPAAARPPAAPGYRVARGWAKSAWQSPSSTFSPRYITSTRSAISATTPMSCVMKITRHGQLALQLLDQRQDLRLDGHVQRRGGLVGDQQRGLAGQRHGDHHALAHAARQLVRMAAQHACAPRGCAPGPACAAPRPAPRGCARPWCSADRFGDLLAHGEHRVERGHRLLEHHRHVGAAQAAHLRLRAPAPCRALAAAAASATCCRSRWCRRLAPPAASAPATITDLPEPDSPTMASVSPAST